MGQSANMFDEVEVAETSKADLSNGLQEAFAF
jgi:hypothetical protein